MFSVSLPMFIDVSLVTLTSPELKFMSGSCFLFFKRFSERDFYRREVPDFVPSWNLGICFRQTYVYQLQHLNTIHCFHFLLNFELLKEKGIYSAVDWNRISCGGMCVDNIELFTNIAWYLAYFAVPKEPVMQAKKRVLPDFAKTENLQRKITVVHWFYL